MDTFFYEILSYFGPHSRLLKLKFNICTFVNFLHNDIWSYFGTRSRLFKPRLKRYTFVYFLRIEFWKRILVPIGHLYLWYLELFWPSFKVGQTKVEKIDFYRLSWDWDLKLDLCIHLRDHNGHLFYYIWIYFCPHSRFVKPRFKIWTFVDIFGIEFSKWI